MSENKKWSTKDIPDLEGKVILITGGNSGLGFESAKALSNKGAEVVIACRSIKKGEEAKLEMITQNSNAKIAVMELDLMDLTSVKNFVEKFCQHYNRLDILLNNAGIMTTPYGLTKDGFESQLGTNHLGHFALTGRLLKILVNTPSSRVVTISSIAHRQGEMDFENLQFEKGLDYTPMKAYSRSKLANLLFTYELQRFFESKNLSCSALSAHPGVANTSLFRYMGSKWYFKLILPLFNMFAQSPAFGALPQLRAATDQSVKGGEYYGPSGVGEFSGYPKVVQSNPASHNLEDAKKLWLYSEKITGVRFEI